ncbi:MAG: VWA domain-containing protein [Myxococcales bacterium]|nr:VWA domain-containing protein [Myxococcales bacterium]
MNRLPRPTTRWTTYLFCGLLGGCSAAEPVGLGTVDRAGRKPPKAMVTEPVTAEPQDSTGDPTSEPNFGNADPGEAPETRPATPLSSGPRVDAILNGSCASSTVQTELLPANVLFALDRSASMVCNPPPTTDSRDCETMPIRADSAKPSKWEITIEALQNAIELMPGNATVGLSYFSRNDRCGVNSAPNVPLSMNTVVHREAIANSMQSVTPGGGTPLVGATILAYQHLHQAALAGKIAGNGFVVLITDGAQSEMCSNPPMCEDADSCTSLLINKEVVRAAAPGVGIRTFVIGVPGSEPSRDQLSEIAVHGGTAPVDCDASQGACHFDMTAVPNLAEALTDALKQITTRAVSCEFDAPRPQTGELDLSLVNVVYTPGDGSAPQLVVQDPRVACDGGANGWQFIAGNARIRLCGEACDVIRADPGGGVEVVLGCPVQGPQ